LRPGTRRQIEEWQAPLRVAASTWPRMCPGSDSDDWGVCQAFSRQQPAGPPETFQPQL